MRIGIVFVFVDYHRNGAHHRGVLQPQIGPLIERTTEADTPLERIQHAKEFIAKNRTAVAAESPAHRFSASPSLLH